MTTISVIQQSNGTVQRDAVDKRPPGFFHRLSAVLTVTLAGDTLLFVALTSYLYPLFHHKSWYLRSPFSKVLEFVPILLIEYATIFLFWYALFLWRRVYQDNPTALHLRAMNMLYEGLKDNATLVIVPSTAIESMQPGTITGFTALQKAYEHERERSKKGNQTVDKNTTGGGEN